MRAALRRYQHSSFGLGSQHRYSGPRGVGCRIFHLQKVGFSGSGYLDVEQLAARG